MARFNYKKGDYIQGSLFDFSTSDIEESIEGGYDEKSPIEGNSELATPIGDIEKSDIIKFISFGSGSSGNCSYIGNNSVGFLIDAGVDIKKVEAGLKLNNINPDKILGICLTHDHGDHIHYAYSFLRKYKHWVLFCTNRVMNGILRRHNISRRIKDYHKPIFKEIPFMLGGFEVTAFEVMHDGSCNSGFSIALGDVKFCFATDLGCITDRVRHYMSEANYLVVEANYDADMLTNGLYPEYLKNRIRANNGHLDNIDAAEFLADIYNKHLKYIFLCHLSKDNNTPEKARESVTRALTEKGITVGEGKESLSDNNKDVQLVVLPRYDITPCYHFRVKY